MGFAFRLACAQNDILFEILLKAGYPLSARIEPVTLGSQAAFAISDGNPIICLDHAFEGNDQLKTSVGGQISPRPCK